MQLPRTKLSLLVCLNLSSSMHLQQVLIVIIRFEGALHILFTVPPPLTPFRVGFSSWSKLGEINFLRKNSTKNQMSTFFLSHTLIIFNQKLINPFYFLFTTSHSDPNFIRWTPIPRKRHVRSAMLIGRRRPSGTSSANPPLTAMQTKQLSYRVKEEHEEYVAPCSTTRTKQSTIRHGSRLCLAPS